MQNFSIKLLCLLLLLPACGEQLVEFPTDSMDASASNGGNGDGGNGNAGNGNAGNGNNGNGNNGNGSDGGDNGAVDGGVDTTAPFVVSTLPVSDASNVGLNGVITARFSEAMDDDTLSDMTFTVKQGTTTVMGAVTYADRNARFDPASDLAPGTIYTATISTGAEDLAGNGLAAAYTWLFTTGTTPDVTAPMVVSTIPATDGLNAPVNGAVAATFNEGMDPLTLNATTFTVSQGTTPIMGTVSNDGITAVFAPLRNFEVGTVYTASITTGATDLAGNALAATYTWSFTTGTADTTAPTIVSTVPGPDGVDVAIGDALSATFSEPMDPNDMETSFKLTQGTTSIAGTITTVGATATFTPSRPLEENTVYTATITTQATDLAGNALATLYSWEFTTGMTPTVVDVSPANNTPNVQRDANVEVTFSESMDQGTLIAANISVTDGTTAVDGTIDDITATTFTFNPTADLDANTTYTATVTRGVTDLAGTPLAVEYSWRFTTGTTPDNSPPTVLSTIPDKDASDVPTNSRLIATFSEPMNTATLNIANFTLTKKDTPLILIGGTVTPVGQTAVFRPNSALDANTTYTATIGMGVEDAAGNAMAAAYSWDFTTGTAQDAAAPTVISTTPEAPAPGAPALNVSINVRPTATFSEPMEPSTINDLTFTVHEGLNPPIAGTVSYDVLNRRATFTPSSPLALNTTYTATVTTGAEDLGGNGLALAETWTFTTSACSQEKVVLGKAGAFAVLAGSTVTSTGPTSVTGNLGVSPGSAVTGFPPGTLVGAKHVANPTSAGALFDLTAAYNDAKGRTLCPVTKAGNLGGQTLPPGLYKSTSSLEVSSGDLTLDAQGDGNAVFIFQMASTLTLTPGRQITLIGGAKAANVFWQVGTSATLGTTSVFKGTVMADQAITLNTGARVEGRLLARIAAVSLASNVIVVPAP